MPSFALDYSQLREQLTAYLPPQVRTLMKGASGRDLVKKIETSFLLFDNKIVRLETRDAVEIEGTDALSIAAACAKLLTTLSAEQRKEWAALLLLPTNFFVATTTTMPGVAKENLVSALKLQADSILPSLEKPLSLAINSLSATQGDEHLALWMLETTLSDLFDAFAAKDIFLAAVKPRFMNGSGETSSEINYKNDAKITILDVDEATETCVVIEDSILKSVLHVRKQDLQQEVFQQQWQKTLLENSSENTIELNDVADYCSHNRCSVESGILFLSIWRIKRYAKNSSGETIYSRRRCLSCGAFHRCCSFHFPVVGVQILSGHVESPKRDGK